MHWSHLWCFIGKIWGLVFLQGVCSPNSYRQHVCPSVRPSVCPSRAGIVSKRRKLGSQNAEPQKRCKTRLLLITNRKSHTRFQLSAEVNDFGWPWTSITPKRCVFQNPPRKFAWRLTYTISGKNVVRNSSFWGCKVYSHIRRSSL